MASSICFENALPLCSRSVPSLLFDRIFRVHRPANHEYSSNAAWSVAGLERDTGLYFL
jgi:hypothetical protein